MEPMIPSPEIQELIRYTAQKYFTKKNYGIRITTLMKILFKAKISLSDNNPLKQQLPYYWYKLGPHSSIIEEYNNYMINKKILNKNTKNEIMSTTFRKIVEHNDDFDEAKKIILDDIESSVSDSAESEMYDTYVRYAPVKFYESFRYDFIRELKKYSNNVSGVTVDDLILMLYKTAGDLPNHSLFSDFKYAYFDFIKIIDNILHQNKSQIESIIELSKTIDEVFAYGMRVKFHDDSYEKDVKNWQAIFEQKVIILNQKIDQLYKDNSDKLSTVNCIKFDKFVEEVKKLKEDKKLKEIIFLSSKNKEERNNILDEEIIDKTEMERFDKMLSKYQNVKNVILSYSENDKKKRIDYKIIT